jgi:subtilisin family serine protease
MKPAAAAQDTHDRLSRMELVGLGPLMERTSGGPFLTVAVVDGPVASGHPDLAWDNIREISGGPRGACLRTSSPACKHGTFIAGILSAQRHSSTPGICPGCTLLLRPVFSESDDRNGEPPTTTPEKLATAIVDAVDAGASLINVSATLAHGPSDGEPAVEEALDYAARRGVITVAAAGNDGTLGGSALVRHPWVVPVVACDLRGRLLARSTLGTSIGKRGLRAPGDQITSLSAGDTPVTLAGTSAAAPLVTGAIALVWSEVPAATAAAVKAAVSQGYPARRSSLVPPLLNAWRAYEALSAEERR